MHRHHRPATHVSSLFSALLVCLASTPAAAFLGLDSTPPDITILRPANESSVRGMVTIEVQADDGLLGSGVHQVEYQIDSTTGAWTPLTSSGLLSSTYQGTWASMTVDDRTHTVCIRATDNEGNQRIAYALVVVGNPPAAPLGVKVSPPPTPSNGGYLDIYWSPNGEGDMAGYAVYRSTSSGGPYTKVANSPWVDFYRDDGLTVGTTYYYLVTAVDAAGNESLPSAEVSGTTLDTRAPSIHGTGLSLVGPDYANIDWNTDERATSQVEYGTTSALGSATPMNFVATPHHRVTLRGLRPGTTYYYKVRSQDASGNQAVSAVFSFTTQTDLQALSATNTPLEPADVWLGASLESNALLEGGAEHLVQVAAADSGAGIAAMEWQVYLVPSDARLEAAPEPDASAWQPLAFNARSGAYEASWSAPVVSAGQLGFLYVRTTDGYGRSTTTVRELTVRATGRDF